MNSPNFKSKIGKTRIFPSQVCLVEWIIFVCWRIKVVTVRRLFSLTAIFTGFKWLHVITRKLIKPNAKCVYAVWYHLHTAHRGHDWPFAQARPHAGTRKWKPDTALRIQWEPKLKANRASCQRHQQTHNCFKINIICRVVTGARNNNLSKSESSHEANNLEAALKQDFVITADEKLNAIKVGSVVLTVEKELKEAAQDTEQLLDKSQNETTAKNATREDSGKGIEQTAKIQSNGCQKSEKLFTKVKPPPSFEAFLGYVIVFGLIMYYFYLTDYRKVWTLFHELCAACVFEF